VRTAVQNIPSRGFAWRGRRRTPVRARRLPRGDTCCAACAAQSEGAREEEFGRQYACHIHNTDVHILIGAPLEEDLLTGATFLGCSFPAASGRDTWSAMYRRTRRPADYAPGVPSKMTVPGTSCRSRAARSASAMPTPAIAIRLCPQPCPIPGSASISAFTPTTRPRVPRVNSARQAVARPR
jgi:hypothetical protein